MLDAPLRLTEELPQKTHPPPSALERHVHTLNPAIPADLGPSTARAYVASEDVAEALNERVGKSLPLVLTLMTFLFASLVAYRWGIQPEPTVSPATNLAGTTAIVLFCLRMMAGFVKRPARWAHPVAAFISGLILANCLLPLQSSPQWSQATLQALNLLLLVIGAGCVFLSLPWLTAVLVGVAGGWWTVLAPGFSFSDHLPLSLGLLAAIALSFFIHGVRLKAYREVLTSQLEEKGRRDRLDKVIASARQTEERYRRFSMATLEGLAVHAKGEIVDANETLGRLFGCSQMEGRKLQDLLAPDSRSMLSEILSLGNYQSVEAIGLRQDGSQFAIEIYNSLIPGEDSLQVAVIRDITERKLAEQSLTFERLKQDQLFRRQIALANLDLSSYTSQELQRAYGQIAQLAASQLPASLGVCLLTRSSQAAPWVLAGTTLPGQPVPAPLPDGWDQPGTFLAWMIDNQEILALPDLANDPFQVARLFPGLELNAFLAAPILNEGCLTGVLIALDDKTRIFSHEDSAFFSGLAHRTATLAHKVQLHEKLHQANRLLEQQSAQLQEKNTALALAKEAAEQASQVLEQQRSQLQAQNQDLVQAKEAAERAIRAKTDFLAHISHELRTPMNGILGMTSLLTASELTKEQREFVENLNASAESLHRLINGLLALVQLDQGQTALEIEDFNLAALVESAIEAASLQAQAKDLELISWVDEDLPPMVRGAASSLRQVLAHLIDNALKFTEQGEVLVSVSKESETASQVELRILVHDTGIGIAPHVLPDLFQPFQQADTTDTRKYEGAGLGLVLSKRLVELMQGQMGVDSTPGAGSDFWFTIRLAKAAQSSRPVLPPAPPLDGFRGLVINSNPTYRLVLQRLMTFYKMRAQGVEETTEAIRLLRQESQDPFQVIILDSQDKRVPASDLISAMTQHGAARAPRVLWLTGPNQPLPPVLPPQIKFATVMKPVHQSRFMLELGRLLRG